MAAAFKEIWCVDFEYNGRVGRPNPVCMVAMELIRGRLIRCWRDDLRHMAKPPFDIGPESLMVAYFASAELGCFLELGWALPVNVLDLFVEHRVETNSFGGSVGNGLLAALAVRGIGHIDGVEKERLRQLILSANVWSSAEQADILAYCQSDVSALANLLTRMERRIDLPRALIRGRYMGAVSAMERNGVPLDHSTYARFDRHWPLIKDELIQEIDRDFGVYDGSVFKQDRFARYLVREKIPWPRHPSGALALDREVFSDTAERYPELYPLHDLRATLAKMNRSGLEVGPDGRARCMLSPFASVTGRNQPSTSRFVFGQGKWMRRFITPESGYGLAYVDWLAQEVGIAAGLSGDEKLIEAYASGDPYMAFAIDAGLAPAGATGRSHPAIRTRCKAIVLGVGYGMGRATLANRADMTPVEASDLLDRHRRLYRKYWTFSQSSVDGAYFNGITSSVLGWKARVGKETRATSLMNFPMQANGAEMMRIAAIEASERGIAVVAPVHDAFLIEAPIEELDQRTAEMQDAMTQASRSVCGIPIRTEAKLIRPGERFAEERGADTWEKAMRALDKVEIDAAA